MQGVGEGAAAWLVGALLSAPVPMCATCAGANTAASPCSSTFHSVLKNGSK